MNLSKKVFIDGSAGTTGLRIHERLADRKDLEIIKLSEEYRKDPSARADAINSSDIVFLCLPDQAAIEAVSMVTSDNTVIIDTSTAHRVDPDWTYGFPEINGLRDRIITSKRIANPGCHASGFIALAAPLVSAGIIPCDASLSSFSLTGYSGGGKKMIAEYEDPDRDSLLSGPRLYGLTQKHKHLPEMKIICGLKKDPVFCPVVAPYYAGMEVIIPLTADQINAAPEDILNAWKEYYRNGLIHVNEAMDENGFCSASAFAGRDDMQISVFGNKDRMTLVSRFDNLGKGASGSAVQNMNLVLGVDETEGLII